MIEEIININNSNNTCDICKLKLEGGLTLIPLDSNKGDIEDAFIEILYEVCKKCGTVNFLSLKDALIYELGEDI